MTLPYASELLLTEGHAIGALIHSGVGLVGTNQDLIQGAVVVAVAVVSALGNGTFDALICIAVHFLFLLYIWDMFSMCRLCDFMN